MKVRLADIQGLPAIFDGDMGTDNSGDIDLPAMVSWMNNRNIDHINVYWDGDVLREAKSRKLFSNHIRTNGQDYFNDNYTNVEKIQCKIKKNGTVSSVMISKPKLERIFGKDFEGFKYN